MPQLESSNLNNETTPLLSEGNKTHRSSKIIKIVVSITAMILVGGLVFISSSTNNNNNLLYGTPSLFRPLKLRLYTNNIRYDNKHLDLHERPWHKRKQLITSSIQFNTFNNDEGNVVCLQEVLHNQLKDIIYDLNDDSKQGDWEYYGVGRTDGLQLGEYAPILFKNLEWLVLDSKTFWLSETPDIPSRGWDAALERIVTMVTLQSKVNPLIRLNFFNTHFDHRGIIARRESSKLIVDKMENFNSYPSFLCGDFNTQPTDEPYHILQKAGFKDSRTLIDKLHHYGHDSTFTGFDKKNEVNTIIDYIWSPYFAKNGNNQTPVENTKDINFYNLDFHHKFAITIKNFAILSNWFNFYMSDHRPVSADYEVAFKI